MIYEDRVIELHDWDIYHPGGKFVLQSNIGHDITKFMIGAYHKIGTEKHRLNHKHSHRAL